MSVLDDGELEQGDGRDDPFFESSDVEKVKAAAERVEDWDGADHFEDCPSRDHESHCCECPDTVEGEEACEDLVASSCDCYLGAMRDCRASILALLSSHERLTREVERLRELEAATFRAWERDSLPEKK